MILKFHLFSVYTHCYNRYPVWIFAISRWLPFEIQLLPAGVDLILKTLFTESLTPSPAARPETVGCEKSVQRGTIRMQQKPAVLLCYWQSFLNNTLAI